MRALALAAVAFTAACSARNDRADEQLAAAKAAYSAALSKTGDFDCLAPEFNDVLMLLDAVPPATRAKSEATDLAALIRGKRDAAAGHARQVSATKIVATAAVASPAPAAAPAAAAVAKTPPGTDPATCKAGRKRMGDLAKARKKDGRPPVGTMSFQPNGEVGFAPGAAPSPEEAELLRTLRACNGQNPDGE